VVAVDEFQLLHHLHRIHALRVQELDFVHDFSVEGRSGGHDAHPVVVESSWHLEAVQAAHYSEHHLELLGVEEILVVCFVH
jgi:hypothetical protein